MSGICRAVTPSVAKIAPYMPPLANTPTTTPTLEAYRDCNGIAGRQMGVFPLLNLRVRPRVQVPVSSLQSIGVYQAKGPYECTPPEPESPLAIFETGGWEGFERRPRKGGNQFWYALWCGHCVYALA